MTQKSRGKGAECEEFDVDEKGCKPCIGEWTDWGDHECDDDGDTKTRYYKVKRNATPGMKNCTWIPEAGYIRELLESGRTWIPEAGGDSAEQSSESSGEEQKT